MTTGFGYSAGEPGLAAAITSSERNIIWPIAGGGADARYRTVNIDSTAVDSANTPTTTLRPGLVMGKLSSTQVVDYDPDATDGSQEAVGILTEEVNMLDPSTAAAADRNWRMLVAGGVISAECINLDQQARTKLRAQGFLFDDEAVGGVFSPGMGYSRVVPKTADYTVVAADHGTLFTTAGAGAAVDFTLPAIAVGLFFGFLNLENQNMVITTPTADDMVGLNGTQFDTLTFSTSNEKIGAYVDVFSMYDGGTLRWVVRNHCSNTAAYAG